MLALSTFPEAPLRSGPLCQALGTQLHPRQTGLASASREAPDKNTRHSVPMPRIGISEGEPRMCIFNRLPGNDISGLIASGMRTTALMEHGLPKVWGH